jgi:hypothetical protein
MFLLKLWAFGIIQYAGIQLQAKLFQIKRHYILKSCFDF